MSTEKQSDAELKKKKNVVHCTLRKDAGGGVCVCQKRKEQQEWSSGKLPTGRKRKPRGKQSPRRTCSTHSAPWHRQRTTRDDEMGSGRSSRARHLTRKEETEDDERGWADGRKRRRGGAEGRGERWEGGEAPFRSPPSCCHHAPPAVMKAPHAGPAHLCVVACAR